MGGDEVAVAFRLHEDHCAARTDLPQDLDQLVSLAELGDLIRK